MLLSESMNCVQVFLKLYTWSTCSDVMSYVVREPEIRHVYGRQRKSVSGNQIFCMELK